MEGRTGNGSPSQPNCNDGQPDTCSRPTGSVMCRPWPATTLPGLHYRAKARVWKKARIIAMRPCHLIFLARRRRCREKNQFFKGVENSIVRPWHQGRSAQLSSAAGDRSGRQSVQSRWRLRKGRAGRCRVCSWRPGGYWIGMRFGCLCEARFYGGFGPA